MAISTRLPLPPRLLACFPPAEPQPEVSPGSPANTNQITTPKSKNFQQSVQSAFRNKSLDYHASYSCLQVTFYPFCRILIRPPPTLSFSKIALDTNIAPNVFAFCQQYGPSPTYPAEFRSVVLLTLTVINIC